MVEWVVSAVEHLGKVRVVGGSGEIEAGKSFIESLERGLEAVQTESFLLVTGDLPYLSREAVDDFLRRADPSVMLNYPIVELSVAEHAYPAMKRTAIKIREGRFTGGNIALIRAEDMRRALPIMNRAYGARKKPLKLAAIVGMRTLFRVAGGQVLPRTLPLRVLEGAVGRFLRAEVRAIITPYPEIAADIDNLAQWRALESGVTA